MPVVAHQVVGSLERLGGGWLAAGDAVHVDGGEAEQQLLDDGVLGGGHQQSLPEVHEQLGGTGARPLSGLLAQLLESKNIMENGVAIFKNKLK